MLPVALTVFTSEPGAPFTVLMTGLRRLLSLSLVLADRGRTEMTLGATIVVVLPTVLATVLAAGAAVLVAPPVRTPESGPACAGAAWISIGAMPAIRLAFNSFDVVILA